MDLITLQALAVIVQTVGVSGAFAIVIVLTAWHLLPVLADLLRSRITVNHATAQAIVSGNTPASGTLIIPK